MKLTDGLHPSVHRDEYDRVERVNFSTLKWMAKSPRHYRHVLTSPSEDTDAKKCGRAIHIGVFEPERYRSAVQVWDGGARRGKDWEKFKQERRGCELLTVNEFAKCDAIQKAVRADPVASRYLSNGRPEVTMAWTREVRDGVNGYSMACKGRVDFDTAHALVDLKSTRDASPEGFGRQVWQYRYHSQSAFYVDGYELATRKRKPYVIVAVESEPPHVVQVYLVPDSILDIGFAECSGWMDQLAFCRANSVWPGYRDAEAELELPHWAMPDFGEDLGGLGLKLGGVPIGVAEET